MGSGWAVPHDDKLSDCGLNSEASVSDPNVDQHSQGNVRTFTLISSGTCKSRLFAENGYQAT